MLSRRSLFAYVLPNVFFIRYESHQHNTIVVACKVTSGGSYFEIPVNTPALLRPQISSIITISGQVSSETNQAEDQKDSVSGCSSCKS